MRKELQTLKNQFNHLLNKNMLHGIKSTIKYTPGLTDTLIDDFNGEPYEFNISPIYDIFVKASDFPNGAIPVKFIKGYLKWADKWFEKHGILVYLVDEENQEDFYDREEF